MSDDDLVKRLREGTNGTDVTKTDAVLTSYMHEAADRIEELEAQNVRLRELLSGFYASEDIEDLLSGWMIYRKQKGEDRNPPSGTERAKLTDEERLKKQIEELRKRDPFIYR
jgi:hypothetical protein